MKYIPLLIAAVVSLSPVCRSAPPDIDPLLKDWSPPSSMEVQSLNQGSTISRVYRVRKPYKEIWAHYAAKLAIKESYEPTLVSASYRICVFNAETDATLSSTMMRRDDKTAIIIHLASSRDEKETVVTIIFEGSNNISEPNSK